MGGHVELAFQEEGFGRRRLAVGGAVDCGWAVACSGIAPALHGLPDVAREDLGQVVMAVELVLVVDAGEGGGGLGGGYGVSPPVAAERGGGTIRSCSALIVIL